MADPAVIVERDEAILTVTLNRRLIHEEPVRGAEKP